MSTFRVVIDYTSKRTIEVAADTADDAAVQAMRQLRADDSEAGPVGYVVMEGDEVVVDKRAWRPKTKRT
jgi:hypothetical protein